MEGMFKCLNFTLILLVASDGPTDTFICTRLR